MKNAQAWQPSKIHLERGKIRVNPQGVAASSYYITLEMLRVLKTCQTYLGGHLVDLGCGNVPFFIWYRDYVQKVTCIDWPGTFHKQSHIDVFADLNQALPLESESANCVLLTSVLEHIHNPQLLLCEINRILAKDGYLILSVPFFYHLHEQPFDYYRYTPHGLTYLAEQSGFEIVKLDHYGSACGVLIDIGSKIMDVVLRGIFNIFPKPMAMIFRKLGNCLLLAGQRCLFSLFQQKFVLTCLHRLNLSNRMALGYVLVARSTTQES